MKLKEIKKAVDCGREVFWDNKGYRVVKDNIGQYLIKHEAGNCIGLTHTDGRILNGKEEEFFMETKYDRLADEINWENWEHDGKRSGKGETEKYFQISEVLYCRLDWLKEQIETGTVDEDEALDTIRMAQDMISGIKDSQLKKIQ
jgi:hypothetical protein